MQPHNTWQQGRISQCRFLLSTMITWSAWKSMLLPSYGADSGQVTTPDQRHHEGRSQAALAKKSI